MHQDFRNTSQRYSRSRLNYRLKSRGINLRGGEIPVLKRGSRASRLVSRAYSPEDTFCTDSSPFWPQTLLEQASVKPLCMPQFEFVQHRLIGVHASKNSVVRRLETGLYLIPELVRALFGVVAGRNCCQYSNRWAAGLVRAAEHKIWHHSTCQRSESKKYRNIFVGNWVKPSS